MSISNKASAATKLLLEGALSDCNDQSGWVEVVRTHLHNILELHQDPFAVSEVHRLAMVISMIGSQELQLYPFAFNLMSDWELIGGRYWVVQEEILRHAVIYIFRKHLSESDDDEDAGELKNSISEKIHEIIPNRFPSYVTNVILKKRMSLLRSEFIELLKDVIDEDSFIDRLVIVDTYAERFPLSKFVPWFLTWAQGLLRTLISSSAATIREPPPHCNPQQPYDGQRLPHATAVITPMPLSPAGAQHKQHHKQQRQRSLLASPTANKPPVDAYVIGSPPLSLDDDRDDKEGNRYYGYAEERVKRVECGADRGRIENNRGMDTQEEENGVENYDDDGQHDDRGEYREHMEEVEGVGDCYCDEEEEEEVFLPLPVIQRRTSRGHEDIHVTLHGSTTYTNSKQRIFSQPRLQQQGIAPPQQQHLQQPLKKQQQLQQKQAGSRSHSHSSRCTESESFIDDISSITNSSIRSSDSSNSDSDSVFSFEIDDQRGALRYHHPSYQQQHHMLPPPSSNANARQTIPIAGAPAAPAPRGAPTPAPPVPSLRIQVPAPQESTSHTPQLAPSFTSRRVQQEGGGDINEIERQQRQQQQQGRNGGFLCGKRKLSNASGAATAAAGAGAGGAGAATAGLKSDHRRTPANSVYMSEDSEMEMASSSGGVGGVCGGGDVDGEYEQEDDVFDYTPAPTTYTEQQNKKRKHHSNSSNINDRPSSTGDEVGGIAATRGGVGGGRGRESSKKKKLSRGRGSSSSRSLSAIYAALSPVRVSGSFFTPSPSPPPRSTAAATAGGGGLTTSKTLPVPLLLLQPQQNRDADKGPAAAAARSQMFILPQPMQQPQSAPSSSSSSPTSSSAQPTTAMGNTAVEASNNSKEVTGEIRRTQFILRQPAATETIATATATATATTPAAVSDVRSMLAGGRSSAGATTTESHSSLFVTSAATATATAAAPAAAAPTNDDDDLSDDGDEVKDGDKQTQRQTQREQRQQFQLKSGNQHVSTGSSATSASGRDARADINAEEQELELVQDLSSRSRSRSNSKSQSAATTGSSRASSSSSSSSSSSATTANHPFRGRLGGRDDSPPFIQMHDDDDGDIMPPPYMSASSSVAVDASDRGGVDGVQQQPQPQPQQSVYLAKMRSSSATATPAIATTAAGVTVADKKKVASVLTAGNRAKDTKADGKEGEKRRGGGRGCRSGRVGGSSREMEWMHSDDEDGGTPSTEQQQQQQQPVQHQQQVEGHINNREGAVHPPTTATASTSISTKPGDAVLAERQSTSNRDEEDEEEEELAAALSFPGFYASSALFSSSLGNSDSWDHRDHNGLFPDLVGGQSQQPAGAGKQSQSQYQTQTHSQSESHSSQYDAAIGDYDYPTIYRMVSSEQGHENEQEQEQERGCAKVISLDQLLVGRTGTSAGVIGFARGADKDAPSNAYTTTARGQDSGQGGVSAGTGTGVGAGSYPPLPVRRIPVMPLGMIMQPVKYDYHNQLQQQLHDRGHQVADAEVGVREGGNDRRGRRGTGRDGGSSEEEEEEEEEGEEGKEEYDDDDGFVPYIMKCLQEVLSPTQ